MTLFVFGCLNFIFKACVVSFFEDNTMEKGLQVAENNLCSYMISKIALHGLVMCHFQRLMGLVIFEEDKDT